MNRVAHVQKRLKQKKMPARPLGVQRPALRVPFSRRIKTKEIADFTRQLATLMAARVPMSRALEILSRQQKNGRFRSLLEQSHKAVNGGLSLSQSLARHPGQFGGFYIHLLRVGEATGDLSTVLDQLALYLEKMGAMRRKVLTAMTYPSIIILVAILALNFIVFGVMPTFSEMFQDFGTQQPWILRALMGFSHFAKTYLVLLLAALGLLIWGGRRWIRTPKGKGFKDGFVIRLPLIGALMKKILVARFTRTLGTLLASGVSFVDALAVAQEGMDNGRFAAEAGRIRRFAEKGESMEAALQGSRCFPEMVVQMIAVGEETSELPAMLMKTAEFYETEVDAVIEALTSIIEPVIIVFLGVFLGSVIISIYMQLFDLMNAIQ